MCTLGVKRIGTSFFLFKTRDLETPTDTFIRAESDQLIVTDVRGHYEVMNEHGLGLIQATLHPPLSVKDYLVPSRVSPTILAQKSLESALNVLRQSAVSANIILATSDEAYLVEKTPEACVVTPVDTFAALTNHGVNLSSRDAPADQEKNANSKRRLERAMHLLPTLETFEDIFTFLADSENQEESILRKKENASSYTQAVFIYDLAQKTVWFRSLAQNGTTFQKYSFPHHSLSS